MCAECDAIGETIARYLRLKRRIVDRHANETGDRMIGSNQTRPPRIGSKDFSAGGLDGNDWTNRCPRIVEAPLRNRASAIVGKQRVFFRIPEAISYLIWCRFVYDGGFDWDWVTAAIRCAHVALHSFRRDYRSDTDATGLGPARI
jgi:hypothetical protein